MDTNNTTPGPETLSQALDKTKNLVAKENLPGESYLTGFQNWLQDRIEDWEKTTLRIGLVGITSAGKSTFINALAGEDILPRGAQPTSGLLVVCRRSPKRQLKVIFKDQSEYEFADDECNSQWVKRYGDEAENPDNEQNVQEMHLCLPQLMIPEKYDLIDSPGLDAFGLQGHEELTLRTLIPLVDVVLFLTTTKSTSDKENLKALAKICKEAKPAIVIQTHKDAVEDRYMKGGKILESAESVLEKHLSRVKELLTQAMGLENAHIIQVSSIQAMNCRLQNPGKDPTDADLWQESGFAEVVGVLEKLYQKVSQKISEKRLRLILKELQNQLDRVKTDYFSARGKEKEAEHYRDLERKKLEELRSGVPNEEESDFPNIAKFQNEINEVNTFFMDALKNWEESKLEELSTVVRDKIKGIENLFFGQSDAVEERLNKIAEELSIDLQAIKPDDQQKQYPDLPEIKRFEKTVNVEILEQAGVSGKVKRFLGKYLKKQEWGYREKEVTEVLIDRDALKEDIVDYHSIYTSKLNAYLKNWVQNWINSIGAVLSAIAQRRDDINNVKVDADPEPYRQLMNEIRTVRDWIEGHFKHTDKKRDTMGFSAVKPKKAKKRQITTKTMNYLQMALPLLQVSRTLTFTRKTHRFWYIIDQICGKEKPQKKILISTPFSQEINDYLTQIGDLPFVEEKDLYSSVIAYGSSEYHLPEDAIAIKKMPITADEKREEWFLNRTQILLFHDEVVGLENGPETFKNLLAQVDMVFRVVDFHQIGHDLTRLNNLPVREALDNAKERLGYIGAGADRLLKGGQFIDAFKSYHALKKSPGFGLCPFVLADGEDLLATLMWLANSLEQKDAVTDELKALDILTRTQPEIIAGRETFIRSFFQEVKQYRREQAIFDEE